MNEVWRQLLWPPRAKRGAWRKNVLLRMAWKTGRIRFAWALPLFVVDDLLEPLVLYLALWGGVRRSGRFAAAARWGATGLLAAWRQLRWAGACPIVEFSRGDVRFSLRLI